MRPPRRQATDHERRTAAGRLPHPAPRHRRRPGHLPPARCLRHRRDRFPDVTEEDVRDAFAEPDYDPDTVGWLGYADNGDMVGYADNGDMVGYAWALRRGSSGAVDIDF